MKEIIVTIKKKLFSSAEKTVLLATTEKGETIKVAGKELPLFPLEKIIIKGSNTEDHYGPFFKSDYFFNIYRVDKDSIIEYAKKLGADEDTAYLLYQMYGENLYEAIENNDYQLNQIKNIGVIQEHFDKEKEHRNLVEYLLTLNISFSSALKAVKLIKKSIDGNLFQAINNNPYVLSSIGGIKYTLVREIAFKKGFKENDIECIEATILEVLVRQEQKGSTCLPQQETIKETKKLIKTVTESCIKAILSAMIKVGRIKLYNDFVYNVESYSNELIIAKHILSLAFKSKFNDIEAIYDSIDQAEYKRKIVLDLHQRNAVKMVVMNNLSVITGGPGTGKTTLLMVAMDVIQGLYPEAKILYAAPTGRAARRMAESTGESTTIHKMLEIDKHGSFKRNKNNPLEADIIVIDESSMIDISIARSLFEAIPNKCSVVFLGDYYQLPSIGKGSFLRELISSKRVPVVKLEATRRQAGESKIIANTAMIKNRFTTYELGDDFKFITSENCKKSADILVDLYLRAVKEFGLENIVILSPYRRKTETGTDALNYTIREKVNPSDPATKKTIKLGSKVFREKDMVMFKKNTEQTSNGDIGFLISIHENYLTFKVNNEFVGYKKSELTDMLDWGYCITVHKSQGSEYKLVLLTVQKEHTILSNNLLYTGITRAKEKVVIVGERKAFDAAIKKEDATIRYSCLSTMIDEFVTE